jgi:prepilin-type N-terminal cleavage/methylation domain-containing protein
MCRRRGFTLLEVMVTTAISAAVLATGYTLYIGVLKTQELDNQRESMMLTVQNAMAQIKKDVRAAGSVHGSENTLVIDGGQLMYESLSSGVGLDRIIASHAKRTYRGVSATFEFSSGGGVSVKLQSRARVGRRLIRIEISNVVFPRNG